MTSGAPPVRPLDVRREQLRELGHTDAEISAIILKEVPPPQPQAAATGMTGAGGVAGQTGVMSGVLNNLSVAIGLVTGFLPSLATDITHLIGRDSSLHVRSRAGVFLAAKLALVTLIGFAIYQEYQQHFISNTEIAKQEAAKKAAEAATANVRSRPESFQKPSQAATVPDEWTPEREARYEALTQKSKSQKLSPDEDDERRKLLLIVMKHIAKERGLRP